jgi:catechol 2,3-dioxygenase-like lactoylglutathione lyase family enzyme
MNVVTKPQSEVLGPPKFEAFAHVSLPCRDLEAGKRFYCGVLGGKLRVDDKTFAAITVGGVDIGIGTEGASFLAKGDEYPHIAFYADPETMLQMKAWLGQCGIPSSNYWTRSGKEALMFFRDPSGNMIELFCKEGFKGAEDLPRAGPRGGGVAVDLDATEYATFKVPG